MTTTEEIEDKDQETDITIVKIETIVQVIVHIAVEIEATVLKVNTITENIKDIQETELTEINKEIETIYQAREIETQGKDQIPIVQTINHNLIVETIIAWKIMVN